MGLPPPPPVNYYRHAYPPQDFHRLRPSSPSPLHLIHPPPPSSHHLGPPPSPSPSQFANFVPPHLLHETSRSAPRVPPFHNQHHNNSNRFEEGPRFSDSLADLPPPEAWLHQHNRRHGPFDHFRPHSETFRYGFIDEGLRDDANREFTSRGSKDKFCHSRNEVHESKHPYPSCGDGYHANVHSHDANLSSNLSTDSQSLGNRIVYNDGDKRDKRLRLGRPGREVTRLDTAERTSYDSNGARYDWNRTGEKFNVSPKKNKAQRKSVLFRLQSGKVESKSSNRSNEEDDFARAQDDELMSTVADSHEGRGKKAVGWSQRQMKEERENSTMELHVSIKSNALVAKPIIATPSPVAAPSKSSMTMNTELEKTGTADFPSIKSSEETLKPASSGELSSHLAEGSTKLNENVMSDESDTGGLNVLSCCDKVGAGYAENASAAETIEFDGQVGSYAGFPPSSLNISTSGGNSTSKQSPGLVSSDFGSAKSVASEGAIMESAISTSKQSPGLVSSDFGSAKSVASEGAIMESAITTSKQSPGLVPSDFGSAKSVASEGAILESAMKKKKRKRKRKTKTKVVVIPHTDVQDKKVTNASLGGVSDLKEVDIEVKPILTSLSQTSPMTSVLSSFGGIDACESSDHANGSINGGCSASYSGNGLVESQIKSVVCEIGSLNDMQDRPLDDFLLSSDSHSEKVTSSKIPFPGRGNKICNVLLEDCTSKNEKHGASCSEECGPSCSDTRLCRKSIKIPVADVATQNAGLEDVFCEDNQNQNVTNDYLHSVCTNGVTFPSKMQSEQDCIVKLSDTDACSIGCFTDDLEVHTSLETHSPSDVSKLPNNASILITGNSSLEISPTSMVSDLDDFGNQSPKVDLLNVKRKRDVRNVRELDVKQLSNTHSNDGSSTSAENFACTKIVRPDNADNMLEKGFPEQSPLGVILADGGKKRKVYPFKLPSPVFSEEFNRLPGVKTTELSTEFPFNSEESDTFLVCRVAPPCSKDPSSVVYTTCSAPSGDLYGSTMVGGPDKLQYVGDDLLEGVPEHDIVTSHSPKLVAGGPEESRVVNSIACGHLNTMNKAFEDSGNIFVMCDMDQKLQSIDVEDEGHLLRKKFPSSPLGDTFHADVSRIASKNTFKNTNSPEDVATSIHKRDSEFNNMSVKDGTITKEIVSGSQVATEFVKPSFIAKSVTNLEDKLVKDLRHSPKTVPSLNCNVTKASAHSISLQNNSMNNKRLLSSLSSSFPHNGSVRFSSSRKRGTISHVAQTRTWHRNGTASQFVAGPKKLKNNVFPLASPPQDIGKTQSSYIRKGNSLVRKPSTVGSDNLKDTGSEKLNVTGLPISETQGGHNAAHERPETPPISGSLNSFDCSHLVDSMPELLSVLPRKFNSVAAFDPSAVGLEPSRVHVCQTNSSSNSDGQNRLAEGNHVKKITYVKRKSNQLVAASSSGDPSIQGKEYAHVSSSDGYYKRRKNQLVRTTSEDDVRQRVALPDEHPLRLEAQKNAQDRSFSAKQSGFLQRKRSPVWMSHGSFSFRKQRNLGYLHRASTFYVPWKKSIAWTNLKSSLNSIAIGRRLPLSKKRDTIYKRSRSGFSLHRSKALIGGSRSLKWSKSMERMSKRASEDATPAVVNAEKRRREQSGAGFSLSTGRKSFSRERIFRIGSERYKMDPAGRILQRISDEKASCLEGETENNSKKLFLPRRLLIGNGEYVRIGNGNQLIRDPKQRTRVLATEKVRWSLHTARLRLARKKKYCLFFTRFGKCNKDGKKCPYIHDPSKIVVCTKFLSASCYNPDCKLTHKVIPERMQDCSYFLQGMCVNESCPYRHVNVNPKSPVCEDFLRGYCADGNECRKRHTYVCPVFQATGSCEQGSNCKLHHPKNKKKALERKTSNVLKNAQGRYFGVAPAINNETTVSEIVSRNGEGDIFCENGRFSDYVSLDFSNEAVNEDTECTVDPMYDTVSQVSSDLDADHDELIKPIRIMNRRQTIS